MEPLSAGMFASIGSAFKFADVAIRIAEVGSENAVFVRAIQVVRSDLEEVERLLSVDSVQARLAGTPGKLPWVKTAISSTRCALNDIGKWVERARVEQESTGSIRFETRVRWVFNDHEKLVNRQAELSMCHRQLLSVLGYLVCLEEVLLKPTSLVYGNATSGNDTSFDEVLSRHRRTSGLKGSQVDLNRTLHCRYTRGTANTVDIETVQDGLPDDENRVSSLSSRPASIIGLPTVDLSNQQTFESTLSLPSTTSHPSSPPPEYTTTVVGPALHNTRSTSCLYSDTRSTPAISRPADTKPAYHDTHWAYMSNMESPVPELAGDTISFSGTNSAGPVDPFEFHPVSVNPPPPNPERVPEVFVEMLGDLHFPVEPSSNTRSPHNPARGRTASETRPLVHRRPLPATALTMPSLPPSLLVGTEVASKAPPSRMQSQKQMMRLLESIGS